MGDLEHGSARILIVAGDTEFELKSILETAGYLVFSAVDEQEAYALVEEHRPSLVIIDSASGEMDSYRVCSHIKKDPGQISVILLTSLSNFEDIYRTLECGADNLLFQPLEEEQLLGRIADVLANRLSPSEEPAPPAEMVYSNRSLVVNTSRIQLLEMLVTTYEAAVAKNRELSQVRDGLDAVTNELDAFSYSVSHDLRAPLRHISGFAAVLLESTEKHLPETSRHYLNTIVKASQKLARLIEEVLVFSRISRTEVRRGSVDLQALFTETIAEFDGRLTGRSITWRVGPLPVVQADSSLLRDVINNLIDNAIKFTRHRDDAEIQIGASNSSTSEVVIFVRDNGIGFDMKYADKLYDVFKRLHSENDYEGTGMGLARGRRIIARHGGRTWAEASPEGGATFYFSLPASPA